MKNLLIVDPVSTGYNFVEDAVRRGYSPVVLTTKTQREGTIGELRQTGAIGVDETPDITSILYKDSDIYIETFIFCPAFNEESMSTEEIILVKVEVSMYSRPPVESIGSIICTSLP